MNQTASPLVSIICPVYNAEAYLGFTIESVLKQTYAHWELLLVIDAKGNQQSLFIAQDYANRDARIKLLQSPQNLGVASNRNAGIQQAQGDYLAFLDSDDLWLPQKLQKQIDFMVSQKVEFTFHSYQQMDTQGKLLPVIRKAPSSISYSQLLKSNVIGCLTVMLKTNVAKQFKFNTNIPHEDFIFWLQILNSHSTSIEVPSPPLKLAYGLPDVLAHYRVLPNSRSGNKKQAALDRWYLYRHELQMNLLSSLYYFTHYIIAALFYRRGKSLFFLR